MLARVKDKTFSIAVKMAINNYIKEYGKMLRFDLDSKNKSIELEVMLDGEKETILVSVERYEILQEGDKHLLKIHGVKTSRNWINSIASSYLEGKTFEIPSTYAKMLKVVV